MTKLLTQDGEHVFHYSKLPLNHTPSVFWYLEIVVVVVVVVLKII